MERVGLLFICGDGGSFTTYQLFAAFVLLLMIENVQSTEYRVQVGKVQA